MCFFVRTRGKISLSVPQNVYIILISKSSRKNSHISIRTAVKMSEPRAKELCLTKDVLPASDHDLTESSNDTLRKVITCRSRKQTRSRKIIPGVYLRQKT